MYKMILYCKSGGEEIYRGKTPTVVTLSTKHAYFSEKPYLVTFSKEGYSETTALIQSSFRYE
jgi:hypothetical protein